MEGLGLASDLIRNRGKIRVLNRSLIATAVAAVLTAPIAWARVDGGSSGSTDRALLGLGLAGLLVASLTAFWGLLDFWADLDHQHRDGRAHRTTHRTCRGLQALCIATAPTAGAGPLLMLLGHDVRAIVAGSAAIVLTALGCLLHLWAVRRLPGEAGHAHPSVRRATVPAEARPQRGRPEWAIACSGGGIRSAAYCLGAFQRLRVPRVGGPSLYDRADAVYSVSGGGYIATGLHVARSASPDAAGDVFMPRSPEEDQLRRTSSYLLSTPKVRTLGLLSLLFGLAINLLLISAVLGLLAWWMAWWLRESAALVGFATSAADFDLARAPWWVAWCWAVPLAGASAFVVRKVWERIRHRPTPVGATDTASSSGTQPRWEVPTRLTGILDSAAPVLVWAGLAVVLLLLAAPAALPALSNAAAHNEPTEMVARLATQAGFVSEAACKDAATEAFERAQASGASTYAACGETRSSGRAPQRADFAGPAARGGIAGALAVVATLAAIVRSMLGDQKATVGRLGGLVRWLRLRALPWLGSGIVVALVVVVFLKWTHDLTLHPQAYGQTWLLILCAGGIVAVKVIADATSSSLHPFYRQRLSATFFLRRTGSGDAEVVPYQRPLLVSDCQPTTGPRLVICAAANVSDEAYIPTQRECTPFRFSTGPDGTARIGFSDSDRLPGAMRSADAFEHAADRYRRDATLAAAMAISGAAVSPRTGRANRRSRPYRLLLALANARLGVWLPNPYWVSSDRAGGAREWLEKHTDSRLLLALLTLVDKPGPLRLAKEAVGSSSIFDKRVYVTDGGHYDNTALVEALRDRPEKLVLIDASNDAEGSFTALADAIATARMDLGLEVTFDHEDLELLKRRGDRPATRGWVEGRAVPVSGASSTSDRSAATTRIWLVKAIVYDGLPLDVACHQTRDPQFPRTSTGDQLYGEYAFEAYRRLGEAAMDACIRDGIDRDTGQDRDDASQAPQLDRRQHRRVLAFRYDGRPVFHLRWHTPTRR